MRNDTRESMIQALLLQMEATTELLRAIVADGIVTQAQAASVVMQTTQPTGDGADHGLDAGCQHPSEFRRDLTTMGSPVRELCRACGAMLENGVELIEEAVEGGGN